MLGTFYEIDLIYCRVALRMVVWAYHLVSNLF